MTMRVAAVIQLSSQDDVAKNLDRVSALVGDAARSGAEIVAGTISTADTYGGGYVHSLFTRRPWRGRGVGAGLLAEAFARFWSRGERSVGLGVDAANETGAFRLYERAGMAPTLSWGVFEKQLGDAPATPR